MRAAVLGLSLLLAGPLTAQAPTSTAQDTVRANLAVARSDLRNLVVAQEAYFSNHGRYASSLDSAKFIPSRGSRIVFTVTKHDAWAATLTRERLVGSCVIFVNLPEAERPKTARDGIVPGEGEPRCDSQPEMSAATTPRPFRF